MIKRVFVIGLVAAVLSVGGCGGESTGVVSGLVTLDGKPVDSGSVSFLSAAGGIPVTTMIYPDGRYKASGVPVGEVLVGLRSMPEDTAAAGEIIKNQGKKGGPPPAAPKVTVKFPDRYADPAASGLKVTVKPERDGEVTFDIPMKK